MLQTLTVPKHKVRQRLQELDELKNSEQDGSSGGNTAQTSTSRRNSGYQGKRNATASNAPPSLVQANSSGSSRSGSDATQYISSSAGSPPFSLAASPDHTGQDEGINMEDFLAGFYSNDGSSLDPDLLMEASGSRSQMWTAPSNQETAHFGFDLFGPPTTATGANPQKPETRFTELMLKIRDAGFADMESSKSSAMTSPFVLVLMLIKP